MKIAILGASRGLGAALTKVIQQDERQASLLLSARDEQKLMALLRAQDQSVTADFSRFEDQNRLLEELKLFQPDQIYYVAGGGPYGEFHVKAWRDHLWAFEVNLLFPARMIHLLLTQKTEYAELKKIVIVGSAIAGQAADPKAAAYAAAKHGLRGLITSLQAENHKVDLQLFEPGYMDTSLLPPNAWPRQQGLAADVMEVARKLWHCSLS